MPVLRNEVNEVARDRVAVGVMVLIALVIAIVCLAPICARLFFPPVLGGEAPPYRIYVNDMNGKALGTLSFYAETAYFSGDARGSAKLFFNVYLPRLIDARVERALVLKRLRDEL